MLALSKFAFAIGACSSQFEQDTIFWASGSCPSCGGFTLTDFAEQDFLNNNLTGTIGIIVNVSSSSNSTNFANVTVYLDASTGTTFSDPSQDIKYGMSGEECTDPDEEQETDPGDGSGGGGSGPPPPPPPGDNGGGGGYFGPTVPTDPCGKIKCMVIIAPAG